MTAESPRYFPPSDPGYIAGYDSGPPETLPKKPASKPGIAWNNCFRSSSVKSLMFPPISRRSPPLRRLRLKTLCFSVFPNVPVFIPDIPWHGNAPDGYAFSHIGISPPRGSHEAAPDGWDGSRLWLPLHARPTAGQKYHYPLCLSSPSPQVLYSV